MNDAAPESHWKFSQILVENIMSPKTLLNILLPKGERRHHRVSKVQQTLSRHCAAAADFVLYYTKGDNCLCSSGPKITTTQHYYYCRSTRAAACRYPDENWEARHQKQRSYSSQLYTWLRHFSRQPEFELRGILLMIYYILRFWIVSKSYVY